MTQYPGEPTTWDDPPTDTPEARIAANPYTDDDLAQLRRDRENNVLSPIDCRWLDTIATLTAERDEARRNYDAIWQDYKRDEAELERLTAERDEAIRELDDWKQMTGFGLLQAEVERLRGAMKTAMSWMVPHMEPYDLLDAALTPTEGGE